jgi:SAM-dependent methyltransferase
MKSNCPLCDTEVSDQVDYLKNMSLSGKFFRYLPNFFGKLMWFSNLKNRFVHGKKMISIFGSHAWHYCEYCNFSYVYPQISPEKLDDYYSVDFWSIRGPSELKEFIFSENNTDRPKYQLNFLNNHGLTKVESMLDFGAGLCGAPAIFKQQGFCDDITILDPSSQAKIIADILDVDQVSSIEDAGAKQFDFLYSSHSLEHVQDLRETLDEFSAIVKEGGHVFIEVPNIANRTVMEMSHHAPHTYNFSQKSLCNAMSLCGFEVVECDAYGVMVGERIKKHHKELDVPDCIISLFRKKSSV